MLKILGAILILFAGTAIGFVQAAAYINRSKQLRQLIHALQRLETEIEYGQTELPEALIKCSQGIDYPVQGLFVLAAELLSDEHQLSMSEAWQEAVEDTWGQTAFRIAEKEALLNMGGVLGMSAVGDQIKHLQLAQLQLKKEEEQAREEQQKYANMWRSLGTLGALLIVILMV